MRVFVLVAAVLAAAAADLPRCDLVPGWSQAGPSRAYGVDTLYDYINGNSEGYLIYGFQKMAGVTCKSGAVSLVIDVSDMPDPESAWGLFASNRDPRLPTERLGMSGQILPQRGIMAKGCRFAEISASPASEDHSQAIRLFLKALEAQLDGTTAPPAALNWFPAEGLDAVSVRLVPQSVLGLGLLKRGYVAKYDYGRAFCTRQASADAASQLMTKLRARFGDSKPAQVGDEAFTGTDRYLGRMLVFRKGDQVAGFANLTDGVDGLAPARAFVTRLP